MARKISKRTLSKIRKRLPDGWKSMIAAEFELQPDTVRKVLDGTRNNVGVLTRAIDMAALPEEEKSKLFQAIAS